MHKSSTQLVRKTTFFAFFLPIFGIKKGLIPCRDKPKNTIYSVIYLLYHNYLVLGALMFACAAASLAIGTRNGEQET